MHAVFLLTGSNLGNRRRQLKNALIELEKCVGPIQQASAVYETEAWGKEGLPPHLNQAILIHTLLEPLELLETIHAIEEKLGRIRQEKWGVRVIDIDIIYFDSQVINLPSLTIPHPLMQERNFVLFPLSEIAPDFSHPLLLKTNKELLHLSSDPLKAVISMDLL